jgi:hypothetical protein
MHRLRLYRELSWSKCVTSPTACAIKYQKSYESSAALFAGTAARWSPLPAGPGRSARHSWQADEGIIAERGDGFQRHISGTLAAHSSFCSSSRAPTRRMIAFRSSRARDRHRSSSPPACGSSSCHWSSVVPQSGWTQQPDPTGNIDDHPRSRSLATAVLRARERAGRLRRATPRGGTRPVRNCDGEKHRITAELIVKK